jgi:hypothetical protein
MRFSRINAVPVVSAANDNLRFKLLCSRDQLHGREVNELCANGKALEAINDAIHTYSDAKVLYKGVSWGADHSFIEVVCDGPVTKAALDHIAGMARAEATGEHWRFDDGAYGVDLDGNRIARTQ